MLGLFSQMWYKKLNSLVYQHGVKEHAITTLKSFSFQFSFNSDWIKYQTSLYATMFSNTPL